MVGRGEGFVTEIRGGGDRKKELLVLGGTFCSYFRTIQTTMSFRSPPSSCYWSFAHKTRLFTDLFRLRACVPIESKGSHSKTVRVISERSGACVGNSSHSSPEVSIASSRASMREKSPSCGHYCTFQEVVLPGYSSGLMHNFARVETLGSSSKLLPQNLIHTLVSLRPSHS